MTLFKCLIFCCPYRTLGFFLCFIILLLLCKLFNLLLLCMLLICLILRAFEPFIFAWLFLLLWVLIVLLVPIFFLRLFQHAGKFCLKVDLAHPTLDTCTFSFCICLSDNHTCNFYICQIAWSHFLYETCLDGTVLPTKTYTYMYLSYIYIASHIHFVKRNHLQWLDSCLSVGHNFKCETDDVTWQQDHHY